MRVRGRGFWLLLVPRLQLSPALRAHPASHLRGEEGPLAFPQIACSIFHQALAICFDVVNFLRHCINQRAVQISVFFGDVDAGKPNTREMLLLLIPLISLIALKVTFILSVYFNGFTVDGSLEEDFCSVAKFASFVNEKCISLNMDRCGRESVCRRNWIYFCCCFCC